MKVKDSVAIVTGGNRGIGEAFVRVLLDAGAARVYVGTRAADGADHLAAEFPDRAVPVTLDVADEAAVNAAALACPDVNVVINNAGAFHNQLLLAASDLSAARSEMEVNYFGSLAMCRAFAPVLARNGGGSIINVLSVGGILPVPNMGGYSPSKFATHAMTTIVRAELAEQGTHVGCLIVGSVDTRMASHVKGQKESPEDVARAGIVAIEKELREMDTDQFAVTMRAAMHRDPAALERRMAAMVRVKDLSTGR
ncbi:SDR family oxidoreductase [Kineobactrum salinum]|uniref:SDR family NAD(P)-dependent oxidoreductase n=1 Tax=Kineobactrum salinum TaxID=2708301 RepID=A0A6C0TZL8_9GAMM|nr:SDR family oxidoreductase [Kineobactrum salinum]QIB65280.1 SDR family NAD(P)-dependent oxidoreductase [Kineobactrum salinum]